MAIHGRIHRFRAGASVLVASLLVLGASGSAFGAPDETKEEYSGLSLEELLNVSVVSASNTAEKLSDAPATVIVLTREELVLRGYQEMSEILDDLPGMQMTRPRGTTYFKNYWRGYRNAIGEPFLVMVDGMVMNHLYYQSATILSTIPMSNVDRVEVVYGPASSVYGPNAFMGVINVITVKDRTKAGSNETAVLAGGSDQARLFDVNEFYKSDAFRVTVTGRVDNGSDGVKNEAWEYTKNKYYTDPGLWGGFLNNPRLAGPYDSHRKNRALDLRTFLGTGEFGFMYNVLDTNYGVDYPGDKEQSRSRWIREELGLWAKFHKDVRDDLSSNTLIRWRKSNVPNDSYESDSCPGNTSDCSAGAGPQVINFTYWQALNSSWSLFQDFDWKATDMLSFTAGVKYEQKDLQKAYDVTAGPDVPVDQADPSTYPFPDPPIESTLDNNRILTEDYGVYLQAKYRITPTQIVNVGVRDDHNSRYGSEPTVRVGYVGSFGEFGVKALYGDAIQEPSPRVLYGGWTGSGSDPNLNPEKSKTFELSGSWTTKSASALASAWYTKNQDRIISLAGGAKNLGEADVAGVDVHLQTLLQPGGMKQLRIWGYYSHVFRDREERFTKQGAKLPSGQVGDLAHNSAWLGVTAQVDDHLSATVRSRYIGPKTTVVTNPIRHVGGYATVDAVVAYDDIGHTGIGLSFRATNLTDKTYLETGVRGAKSGNTPGYWDDDGFWHGSRDFYNSLLPQPGRELLLAMNLRY